MSSVFFFGGGGGVKERRRRYNTGEIWSGSIPTLRTQKPNQNCDGRQNEAKHLRCQGGVHAKLVRVRRQQKTDFLLRWRKLFFEDFEINVSRGRLSGLSVLDSAIIDCVRADRER